MSCGVEMRLIRSIGAEYNRVLRVAIHRLVRRKRKRRIPNMSVLHELDNRCVIPARAPLRTATHNVVHDDFVIGIRCRWKYRNSIIISIPAHRNIIMSLDTNGIAGGGVRMNNEKRKKKNEERFFHG